jgi:hypothetical protein
MTVRGYFKLPRRGAGSESSFTYAPVTTVVLSRIQAFRNVLGCLESYPLFPGDSWRRTRRKWRPQRSQRLGPFLLECHEGIKMAPARGSAPRPRNASRRPRRSGALSSAKIEAGKSGNVCPIANTDGRLFECGPPASRGGPIKAARLVCDS